jgi:hypothetical protein
VLASADALPYAAGAVIASLGVAFIAALAAIRVKRRSTPQMDRQRRPSPPRRKRRQLPPLPDPLFGRAKHQTAMTDVPSFRLVPGGSDDRSQGTKAKSSDQAPASIGPSPVSSDPLFSASDVSPSVAPTGASPMLANGSGDSDLPHGASPDGSV